MVVNSEYPMSIQLNRDGTILFISDADGLTTQLEPAGQTGAQITAAYATFQGTWSLAWWKITQQQNNLAYLQAYLNLANFVDGGASQTVSGTAVANFLASLTNNYRSKKAAIAAATTSTQVMAIDVTSGYPSNP
jgi:hypothetical protein